VVFLEVYEMKRARLNSQIAPGDLMSLAKSLGNGTDPHGSKGHTSGKDLGERVRPTSVKVQTTNLVELKSPQTWAAKLGVKCYRVVGLAILIFVLAALLSYIAFVGFYSWNSTWISPQIISATDERVRQLNHELGQERLLREKLSSERLELVCRLRDAQRRD